MSEHPNLDLYKNLNELIKAICAPQHKFRTFSFFFFFLFCFIVGLYYAEFATCAHAYTALKLKKRASKQKNDEKYFSSSQYVVCIQFGSFLCGSMAACSCHIEFTFFFFYAHVMHIVKSHKYHLSVKWLNCIRRHGVIEYASKNVMIRKNDGE